MLDSSSIFYDIIEFIKSKNSLSQSKSVTFQRQPIKKGQPY